MANSNTPDNFYSYDALAIIGVVSGIVHIIVRTLAHVYPNMATTLLNIMIVVNISLIVYYGMAIFMYNN